MGSSALECSGVHRASQLALRSAHVPFPTTNRRRREDVIGHMIIVRENVSWGGAKCTGAGGGTHGGTRGGTGCAGTPVHYEQTGTERVRRRPFKARTHVPFPRPDDHAADRRRLVFARVERGGDARHAPVRAAGRAAARGAASWAEAAQAAMLTRRVGGVCGVRRERSAPALSIVALLLARQRPTVAQPKSNDES